MSGRETAWPRAVAAVHAELRRQFGESLPVRLWDGSELGEPAAFRIVLRRPSALRRLLLPPSDLKAGEAYVEGDIDLEGDVVAAMAAGARLGRLRARPADAARLLRLLLRLPSPPRRRHSRRAHLSGRVHSRDRDRAAIAFHYDLPNEFYRQFLDANLVYSCGYFSRPDENVGVAQRRKLDVICRKLRLRPGMRMLDIGCGWGSLLLHAARHYGVTGVGVTLSRTQAEAGRERSAAAGFADRVEVRLGDYRDLDGAYDAVASVGMFEHVGPENYADYFSTAYRLTAPGGLFLNHGICAGDPEDVRHETTSTFVGTYVFPDGGLAPAWRAVQEMEQAGFEVLDLEQLRPHYALTVREWLRRLEANRDAARRAAGEAEYRIWRAYLGGSAFSFESGSLGLVQVLGSKGADLPLGRPWMLPRDAVRSAADSPASNGKRHDRPGILR